MQLSFVVPFLLDSRSDKKSSDKKCKTTHTESFNVRFFTVDWLIVATWLSGCATVFAQAQAPNLNDIPNRLTLPKVVEQPPAAA